MRVQAIAGMLVLGLAGCQTAVPDAGSAVTLETNYRLVVECFERANPTALAERQILRTGFAVTRVTLDPDTTGAYLVTFTETPVYKVAITGEAIGTSASTARWSADVLPAVNACNERAKRGDA